MVKPVKKKSRRHSLARGGRAADPKGERFFLQGQRWRLPKGLGLAEVEARIVRLRALWTDQEKLCQDSVFVNLSDATFQPDYYLENAVAAVRTQVYYLIFSLIHACSIQMDMSRRQINQHNFQTSLRANLGCRGPSKEVASSVGRSSPFGRRWHYGLRIR